MLDLDFRVEFGRISIHVYVQGLKDSNNLLINCKNVRGMIKRKNYLLSRIYSQFGAIRYY